MFSPWQIHNNFHLHNDNLISIFANIWDATDIESEISSLPEVADFGDYRWRRGGSNSASLRHGEESTSFPIKEKSGAPRRVYLLPVSPNTTTQALIDF